LKHGNPKQTTENAYWKKVSRIREIKSIKQEVLAQELGITQQAVSKLEQNETIEDVVLEKIAKVLGVTVEAIKNFNEKVVFTYFNTFNDNSTNHGVLQPQACTFNPLDKLMEVVEENKKLYERLLDREREKVESLRGEIQV